MKAVIGGSHIVSPAMVATHVLQQLASLPIDASVLLRGPLVGQPGPVEILTAELCRTLAIPFEYRRPEAGAGSAGTIERDYEMVVDADLVIAYFGPEHVMDPDFGTTRLVEHALRIGKEVHAYAPRDEGGPEEVGSEDGMIGSGHVARDLYPPI